MYFVTRPNIHIVNKRIAEALSENRSRDFCGEIKRIRQKRAACSNSVDGFSNSSDIADLFADKFHELYTTVGYDKDELLDICNYLNVSLHDALLHPGSFDMPRIFIYSPLNSLRTAEATQLRQRCSACTMILYELSTASLSPLSSYWI